MRVTHPLVRRAAVRASFDSVAPETFVVRASAR